MAPRKRRGVGRVKGPTHVNAVNTRGFAALADEIYLEIVSHIPSVPIPTSLCLKSYPEIRCSRHETFLSLVQTSRSLRRFFWRYLWQRIEVREGMKILDIDGIRKRTACLSNSAEIRGHRKYATELVRQLEIVTIRNPLLAQYVNYLDIFIGEYSIVNVLTELARCLSLFPNLHTVQIDVTPDSKRLRCQHRSEVQNFKEAFKKWSYPQIRNVFVTYRSVSFVASCPQARRVGLKQDRLVGSGLQTALHNCPPLEVLEDFGEVFGTPGGCMFAINNFPNLHTIHLFRPYWVEYTFPSHLNQLEKLNRLQTIILHTSLPIDDLPPRQLPASYDNSDEQGWIASVKRILIQIQLRDNLEKTLVVRCFDFERRILIEPKSSIDSEGSFG